MNIRYEPIFDVLFEHSYYADGQSADFAVAPSADTLKTMRNLGLVIKPLRAGFRVFCKLNTRVGDDTTFYSAARFDVPFSLVFKLVSANAWFDNFTSLPTARSPKQAYYFSNRVQVSGADAGNLLLGEAESSGGTVGAGDQLNVVGNSASWIFPVPAPQVSTQISWVNSAGATVLQRDFTRNESNQVQAHFDRLEQIPNGRYHVVTNPVTAAGNRILYKDPALAAQIPFGLVEIFSNPAHADYRLHQDEAVDVGGQIMTLTRLLPKVYRIRFERRSMPWQFFVVRRTDTPPDPADLQVVYGADQAPYPAGVTFSEQAVPGQPAQRLFRSSAPLPFFQTPKLGLELRHKPAAPAIEPLANLPNPPVSAVRLDSGGDFYAESVIYI